MIKFEDGKEIILTYKRSERCPNPWSKKGDVEEALLIEFEEGWYVTTSKGLEEQLINLNVSAGTKLAIKREQVESKKGGYKKFTVTKQ